jgi:hypothetical protein
MALSNQYVPQPVYELATHLDEILAACEDLRIDAPDLMSLELSAISHALQARRCLQDLWVDDPPIADQSALFVAVTSRFLQARTTHAPAGAAPAGSNGTDAVAAEDYPVGGMVPAGVMADCASALLNALEARYGQLWPEAIERPVQPAAVASAQDFMGAG